LTLHGEMQDEQFLRFLERVGRENLSRFTPQEFLALELVHRDQPIPANLIGSITQLVELGAIEVVGHDRYQLSRKLYTFTGPKIVDTLKRSSDREIQKSRLLEHIMDNNDQAANWMNSCRRSLR
jgi:hypothetical protein